MPARRSRASRSNFESSMFFEQAIQDLKPLWMLEDMRTMETFYMEKEPSKRIYTPLQALLYAIVHDNRPYAQHLLTRYPDEVLAKPGDFCPLPDPHLAKAVYHDRRHILGLILKQTRRTPKPSSCADQAGCFLIEDGRTALHLACDLLRPEAVIMLLGSGASPHTQDPNGLTPLDVVLEKFRDSKEAGSGGRRRQCLDHLLLFMPKLTFTMRGALRTELDRWSNLLGEETYRYLVESRPAPLVLTAMQTILRQLSPDKFPDSLHELPIPSALKTPGPATDPGAPAEGGVASGDMLHGRCSIRGT